MFSESEVAAQTEQKLMEGVVRQGCRGIRLDVQDHLTALAEENLASSGSLTSHGKPDLPPLAIRFVNGPETAGQQHPFPCPVIARLVLLLVAAVIWSVRAVPVAWICHIHDIA